MRMAALAKQNWVSNVRFGKKSGTSGFQMKCIPFLNAALLCNADVNVDEAAAGTFRRGRREIK